MHSCGDVGGNSAGNNSSAPTGIDRVAGLYVSVAAGVLLARAGRDLNLTAAQSSNASWDAENYARLARSQDVGSQINTKFFKKGENYAKTNGNPVVCTAGG